MVHLICLRCNRANPSDARFCSQCGAGLLRRFCSECHVINDAESHFCMSCGAALSTQPPLPAAAPTSVPSDVPELTDVAIAGADETPLPSLLAAPAQVADDAMSLQLIAVGPPPAMPEGSRHVARAPLLFGFGGMAVMLVAAALWSRPTHNAPAVDADSPATAAAVGPLAHAAIVAPAASAAQAGPAPVAALTAADKPLTDAIAPMTTRAAAKEAKPTARDAGPDALLAARPPAAGPSRRAAPEPRMPDRQATPPRAVPAPECTPQVDALGLCAPGTTVTGR